jgi:hypothetical protein
MTKTTNTALVSIERISHSILLFAATVSSSIATWRRSTA